jgi:pyridinium-3,5-biscarboxylic acid mononucleotide synthase
MQPERLRDLLADVAAGAITTDEAIERLADLPFSEILDESGYDLAHVDHHRELRLGFPETIFCEGKTPEQVSAIAADMLRNGPVLLATRANEGHWEALRGVAPDAARSEIARVMWVDRRDVRPAIGNVLVVTGGTSDQPAAEEAAVCAEVMGNRVTRLFDVGVAGVHRLLAKREHLAQARVIVAVAGMEGALPSLVAGLVGAPVVAVPTSVGYGASFGGLAAMLTMITSCAPGIGVVNIDNGFGAAALATRINQLEGAEPSRGEAETIADGDGHEETTPEFDDGHIDGALGSSDEGSS